jgi:hypothetical protein
MSNFRSGFRSKTHGYLPLLFREKSRRPAAICSVELQRRENANDWAARVGPVEAMEATGNGWGVMDWLIHTEFREKVWVLYMHIDR